MSLVAGVLLGTVYVSDVSAAERATLQVEVSGDVSLKASVTAGDTPGGPADVNVTTDYWINDAQMREMITGLNAKRAASPTPEETKHIDELMKSDPRLTTFLLRASDPTFSVGLSAGTSSKYKDLPFKPAHLPISAGTGLSTAPGELRATFKLIQSGKAVLFKLDKPGALELTQFDKKGAKGTFSFTAKEINGTRSISVKGSFSSPCHGPIRGSACAI